MTTTATTTTTLHYATLIKLHCATLHYTRLQPQLQLQLQLRYITQHYVTLHYTNYITLSYYMSQRYATRTYTNYLQLQLQLHYITLELH